MGAVITYKLVSPIWTAIRYTFLYTEINSSFSAKGICVSNTLDYSNIRSDDVSKFKAG